MVDSIMGVKVVELVERVVVDDVAFDRYALADGDRAFEQVDLDSGNVITIRKGHHVVIDRHFDEQVFKARRMAVA